MALLHPSLSRRSSKSPMNPASAGLELTSDQAREFMALLSGAIDQADRWAQQ